MNNKRNICVFIPSNRRPDNLLTYKYLKDNGYTGEIIVICDDEDPTLEQYKRKLGINCVVFNKSEYDRIDTFDNKPERSGCVYARNAIQDIAEQRKVTHYLVIDDDLKGLYYRYIENGVLRAQKVKNLDKVFEIMFDLLDQTQIFCVAFSQAGELFGGINSGLVKKGVKRKIMNSFFCRTDRKINFYGRTNEDVNAYVLDGMRGKLFFTIFNICLVQPETQKIQGGMTEFYKKVGTFIKSMYSVICSPSSVKVSVIGTNNIRCHHHISFKNTVPCLISEKWKK